MAFHAVQSSLTSPVLNGLNLPFEVPILAVLSNVLILLGVPAIILKIMGVAAPASIMAA